MRVISGLAKGMQLKSPQGLNTRPTTDRVKESIFSIIYPYIMDSHVLDLFSGTGALGIEALSRGAKKAYFIDHNKNSLKITEENIIRAGFKGKSVVLLSEARQAIEVLAKKHTKFHIILMDPPYLKGLIIPCIEEIQLNKMLEEDGIILVEHDFKDKLPEKIGYVVKVKEKKYGNTCITVYSREDES